QQVADVLAAHPEIAKVEVQGYTDNVGGPAYNQKLSERRAASVRKWLTTRGKVDTKRLGSKGLGLELPIADNSTEEGRQKNRRVEFKIIELGPGAESSSGAKPAAKPASPAPASSAPQPPAPAPLPAPQKPCRRPQPGPPST